MAIAKASKDICCAEIFTGHNARAIFTIRIFDQAIIAAHFNAFKFFARDKVRNAANRVRTISHSGAILQNFYPLQRKKRHQIGINQPITGGNNGALAVQQHQRALRPQTAKVDRSDAAQPLRICRKLV